MTRRSPMAPLAGGLMLPFLAMLANAAPAVAAPPPTPPPPVHIVTWSQWGPDDALGQFHVVGEVVNGDSLQRAADIRVTASGPGVLETVDAGAEILAPGDNTPFDVPLNQTCTPCAVTVAWAWTAQPANHKFTVATNPATTDADGTQHITGTVTNTNKTAADNINVLFTFYDPPGHVVDADRIPLNNNDTSSLAAGNGASFELVRSHVNPSWSTKALLAESSSPPSLPIVSPTPVPLDAGSIAVGKTTSASLTVDNTGNDDLHVTGLAIGGDATSDYAVDSNGCTGAIAPAGSCVIVVDFSPSEPGTRAAALSITDEAADSPQAVGLTGQGLAPAATVPSAVAFGDVVRGTSRSKTVTVTNSGTMPLHVDSSNSGISAGSSNFSANPSGCAAAVAPQQSCSVQVAFAPASAAGDESATLAIFDDAFGSSEQDVQLTATSTDPVLTVTPASLTFSAAVTTSSAHQTVTVKNTPGSGNLHVGTVTLSGAHPGDFNLTDGCTGQTLAENATCPVQVVFTPQALGDRGATLVVTADARNSSKSVALNATGTAASLAPSSFDYGVKNVGSASAPKTFTLSNGTNRPLTISSITLLGDFARTGGSCSVSVQVAGGGQCTIIVTFTPTTTGVRNGVLTVSDDAAGSSQQAASLTGTGMAVTAGWVRIRANMSSSPALASSSGSRLDAFGRGQDLALYQVSSVDGGSNWGNWSRIPGNLSEAPAAVASGGGRIDVFVRGTDLALYHRYTLDGGSTWSGWQYIRATMSAAPSAATLGPGKFVVVVRGRDLALYVITSNDGGMTWGSWQYIRATTSSAPSVVAVGNRVDIFARGQDMALYRITSLDGGKTWNDWQRIAGKLNSAPAAASWGTGRLDVYVRGTDLALYHIFSADGGATWSAWERFAASMTSDPAAVAAGPGVIDVVARGQDNSLYHIGFTIH